MKHYFLTKAQQRPSKINGGYYWNIQLECVETGETFETSVDPAYKNYANWRDVIANRDQGLLMCNLKTKLAKGGTVINADSRPEILFCVDRQTLLDIVEERRSSSQFGELFE